MTLADLSGKSSTDDGHYKVNSPKATDFMKRRLQSTLARNTFWMTVGQGMRLLIQAAYFTVIARSLGVTNYGAFVGVSALVGIAYPFGSLGGGNILIRDVARDHSVFRSSWGSALSRTLLFASTLVLLILMLSHFVLPHDIPLRLIFLIALSDILGLNLILLSAFAFQAFERLQWTSAIYILISLGRLLAALILVWVHPKPSALQWGYAYLGSTVAVAVASFWITAAKLGWPKLGLSGGLTVLREGFYFAAGMSAQTIYNDLDKTMLARLGTLEATGIYGAAYRVIEVGFSPVLALLNSAYPSFFRFGLQGIGASIAYAKPLMFRALGFSLLICIGLVLGAGMIPMVLGSQYAPAAEALRWLAIILPIRSIHSFLSDVLTSSGHQGIRTFIQIGVAVVNALINLWAIPAYSWRGASLASVVSDGLLAIAVGVAVWLIARLSKKVEPSRESSTPVAEALV